MELGSSMKRTLTIWRCDESFELFVLSLQGTASSLTHEHTPSIYTYYSFLQNAHP